MLLLLTTLAYGRDLVLVGERYVPASYGGWPTALRTCLDAARPGAFNLVDLTSPRPSPASVHSVLDSSPSDAIVIVAMTPPDTLGPFGRLGWRHKLTNILEHAAAGDRTALLFGPWPAAKMRVRTTGTLPPSALGITVDDPRWARAGTVADRVGVLQVPWEGPEANAAAALLPPDRPPPSGPTITSLSTSGWADLPRTDASTLGRLACGSVLHTATPVPEN